MQISLSGVTIGYTNSPPCLAALAAGSDTGHAGCARLGGQWLEGDRLHLEACMCPCHIDIGHTFALARLDSTTHPHYWDLVTRNWQRGGDAAWEQIEETFARLLGPV